MPLQDTPLIEAIPVLRDNYVWALRPDGGESVVVVDPGEAGPVLDWLSARGLRLGAQIVTHHHRDHTGGLAQLRALTGAPVYAPATEDITPCDHRVHDGEHISLLDSALEFTTLSVPGHTLGAMAWVGPGLVCSGDTLFAAGCGRLFEGTAAQMHHSLARLATLPASLWLLCGHEYTVANLAFAAAVEPDNREVSAALAQARALRAAGRPTLPTRLGDEQRLNPFLRTAEAAVHAAVEAHAGRTLTGEVAVFAALRAWKDNFQPPP